jgi:drug/metabolite transporter (DMT)-like permease
MGIISIIISGFGVLLISYGIGETLPQSVSQQWTMIGGGFLFGGLFLYVYSRKNNSIRSRFDSMKRLLIILCLVLLNDHS